MGYTVMAYAQEGYQEFILPELDNANFNIVLDKQIFGLNQDQPIFLEIVDAVWRFLPQREYRLTTYHGEDGSARPLEDGMTLQLRGIADSRITLVSLVSEERIPIFQKYTLAGVRQITIGKERDNTISYDFNSFISRHHAVIYQCQSGWVLQDSSSNGTYLNGHRVSGQVVLKFGDKITLFGLRLIFLDHYLAVCALSGDYSVHDAALSVYHPTPDSNAAEPVPERQRKEYFKRSPRTAEELFTDVIEIEAPPVLNRTKKRPLLLTIGPSLTMAIPMMLGCLMAILSARSRGGTGGVTMFTGVVTAISSAVIGVLWALSNLRYTNAEEEENEELRYNAYGQYLIDMTEVIREKYEENRQILFRQFLSGQECCNFTKQDVRLWNHNISQTDFMMVRLGTGTLPFQAEMRVPKEKFVLIREDLAEKPGMIRDTYQNLYAVPVCVDIRKNGLIGIIGGREKIGAYAVACNIIAQLAANNCYTDVKMVFLCRECGEENDSFRFAKWLPHVWMEEKKLRLIAKNKSDAGDIFYELAGVLRKRTEEEQAKEKNPLPHYVIFVDDPMLLEGELLENYIYHPKQSYGITTVLLVEKYEDLPNSCEFIIQNDSSASRFFHVSHEEEDSRDLAMETVSVEELTRLARRLCDIEVKETTGGGEIPASLDFFEMFGVHSLEQLNVIDRWKKNRNYENMRVPIGQKNGGAACYLDIHEKYHGPHGLIAGTTGSGKSETLQTYILSLAVNFSPDDIAFFIIDFKGGGMANLFSNLPHMAGQISNLSGNQVRRAMISIKSENQRRQRIFAEHSVNNINLYTRLYKNHEANLPVPHLFIIIDEFAELKREEPEFMKELISVAQVGRSLGVHLILATQKPSGTVDDNIWSNSRFRLCLRVQDRQDSNDMLHKPDASYITQAGRGYLQVGNDEIYEQFQSGFSGAEYIADPAQNKSAAAVMLTTTGKQALIGGGNKRKRTGNVKPVTQLDAVIDYLNQMAERFHYDRRMLLWLPVLPEQLYLSQLQGFWDADVVCSAGRWAAHEGEWRLETMVGLYDDPVNQAQEPLYVNFSEGGHMAVCGTVASGKSTFLQTFLYGMIHRYSPQEINFYILDYSSRMLLPYAHAPHCGGVIIDTDTDRVQKFFYMINRMMEERKELFGGGNYSQYLQAERNKGGDLNDTLPAIFIVIDNYSNFREKTGSQYDDAMQRISREGVGYGIFLVMAAAGFGANEIPNRVGDNIRTVISLEMGDKFKYAEFLRTTRVEIMPETGVKGRGLAYVHGDILEFQTALAIQATDSYQMSEQIKACCVEMRETWKGSMARRIPSIPEHPVFSDFVETEEYQTAIRNRRYLPMGYNSTDASVYSADLWNNYCYMIQGKGRSGRKNVLKMLMYAASKRENTISCVIELKGQELKSTAEQLGVEYLENGKAMYDFFKETVSLFKERNEQKHSLMKQGVENEELAERMNEKKQIFIFIADMVSFAKAIYQPAERTGDSNAYGDMHAYLENITEKGSCHGFYFFGILNQEQISMISGYTLYRNMISYKTGMHLGGNLSAQRLFQFGNLSFQEQSKPRRPGVGYASNPNDVGCADTVILPLVRGGFT